MTQNPQQRPSFEEVVNIEQLLGLEWYPKDTDSKETWERAWNRLQVIAAYFLIYHFFGEKWYRLVFRDIQEASILTDPAYLRYVKSSRIHPLTQMSLSGRPEMDARIIRLGQSLKTLGFGVNDTKSSVKMDELRSDSFSAAYFELKVASIYARSGFDVEFLKPPKNSKSPDLRIARDGNETFLECKKRKPQSDSSLATRVRGVTDRLRDAHQQIAAVSKHGIVYIEVEDNLSYIGAEVPAYSHSITSAA